MLDAFSTVLLTAITALALSLLQIAVVWQFGGRDKRIRVALFSGGVLAMWAFAAYGVGFVPTHADVAPGSDPTLASTASYVGLVGMHLHSAAIGVLTSWPITVVMTFWIVATRNTNVDHVR